MSDVVAICESLYKTYRARSETVAALVDMSASFFRGECVALAGPSGSGKTTLLSILAGLDRPTSGRVETDGINIGLASRSDLLKLRRRVGFILQRPADNTISYLSAAGHMGLMASLRKVPFEAVDEVLGDLNLLEQREHMPRQLSGGEQQRLALAQAVIGNPPLILADEPTGQLDRTAGRMILDLLRAAADEGAAVIVGTHDPNVVAMADTVINISHGRRL